MRHKSSYSWMSTISLELSVRVITISSMSSRFTSFCRLHHLCFKELANAAETTPSLIINLSPNHISLTSFGSTFITC